MPYLPIVDELTYEDDFIDKLIEEDNASSLRQVLDICLREKEKDIIMKRYGLDDGEAKTLEEVGIEFGVTRERVRQIENKALRKLKIHYKVPVD